jgi:hypothetical protein
MPAARIGPTVCELDGPIPILNRSNALIAIARLLSAVPRRCGTASLPIPAPAAPAAARAGALGRGAAPHPFSGGIERRAQRHRHRPDLTSHVYLV